MNNLYFVCSDCKIFVNAGYRWAYCNLIGPGVVTLQTEVNVDRVFSAAAYWTPPHEVTSDWLYKDVLPSVRQFLSDHRGHRIVFWDENDLPEDYFLEWLQVGYSPCPTARFLAETLGLRDWDAVLDYDKTVGHGYLEFLLFTDEEIEAFQKAFYRWCRKANAGGPAGAT
jgi:hypothetical protein